MPEFDPSAVPASAPTSAQSKVTPLVYLGRAAGSAGSPFDSSFGVSTANSVGMHNDIRTADEGQALWYQMSDQEHASMGQTLYRAGVINDPNNYNAIQAQWNNAVNQAANYYTVAGRKISPWEFLNTKVALNGSASGGPQTSTNKSTSVNISSPADAEAAVKTIYQQGLGRDPDKAELARYTSLLVGKQRANPSVTTTTARTDGKGNTVQSSTSTGGLSGAGAQQALNDQLQADPEYGSYQAATTYYSALMRAIASP